MDRERLEFKYFFNAGLDKVTGICDGELEEVMAESGIFTNAC